MLDTFCRRPWTSAAQARAPCGRRRSSGILVSTTQDGAGNAMQTVTLVGVPGIGETVSCSVVGVATNNPLVTTSRRSALRRHQLGISEVVKGEPGSSGSGSHGGARSCRPVWRRSRPRIEWIPNKAQLRRLGLNGRSSTTAAGQSIPVLALLDCSRPVAPCSIDRGRRGGRAAELIDDSRSVAALLLCRSLRSLRRRLGWWQAELPHRHPAASRTRDRRRFSPPCSRNLSTPPALQALLLRAAGNPLYAERFAEVARAKSARSTSFRRRSRDHRRTARWAFLAEEDAAPEGCRGRGARSSGWALSSRSGAQPREVEALLHALERGVRPACRSAVDRGRDGVRVPARPAPRRRLRANSAGRPRGQAPGCGALDRTNLRTGDGLCRDPDPSLRAGARSPPGARLTGRIAGRRSKSRTAGF